MCPEIKSPLNEAHFLVFSSLPRLTISTLFNFQRAIAGHLGAKQLNMNPASVGLSMAKEYSRSAAKSRKSGGQETIQQILDFNASLLDKTLKTSWPMSIVHGLSGAHTSRA